MRILEQQLRERIGLDAATLGSSIIERTVRLRMKALRLTRVPDYRELLAHSPAEWKELIEAVVVAETWFFRDPESFRGVTRLVLTEWWAAHPTAPLRLLSIPCSTGEEPYSLAMALLDAGLPRDRFRIDAVDISERALAAARKGVYGRNSFRGDDLAFRNRHFSAVKEGYALAPAVRECVDFSQGNLLDDGFLPLNGVARYDFIFCRNLLIYFDRPTQACALQKLERLLDDKGVLFVGPAELPLAANPSLGGNFVSAHLPLAFACRKANSTATPALSVAQPTRRRRELREGDKDIEATSFSLSPSVKPATSPLAPPGPAPSLEKGLRPPPVAAHVAPPLEDALRTARRLADAGQLHQAAALCHACLRQNGDSAQAHYLLGLIADAQGLASAAEFYRKALYLDPDHYDALMQLALLSARQGDTARARVLKTRAERTGHRLTHDE